MYRIVRITDLTDVTKLWKVWIGRGQFSKLAMQKAAITEILICYKTTVGLYFYGLQKSSRVFSNTVLKSLRVLPLHSYNFTICSDPGWRKILKQNGCGLN